MGRREPKDTRDKILQAALAEFAERGFHGASIDDVAARAGVTKGAVYYWFTDKDDLARDLARSMWERLKQQALATFDPSDDMITNIERGFDTYLAALQRLGEARFFLRDVWSVPSDDQDRDDAYAYVRWFLEEGIARGELQPLDADALAHVLVGMYSEATLHILTTGDAGPTRDVVRRLVSALVPDKRRARTKAGAR